MIIADKSTLKNKVILVLISFLILFSTFFIGSKTMNIPSPTQFTDDSHYQNTIIKHSRRLIGYFNYGTDEQRMSFGNLQHPNKNGFADCSSLVWLVMKQAGYNVGQTAFSTPEMENDANCAALAEVWKGAASDVQDCCFIVSGTGIGGAVVKDRRIHKGEHLHGGEFGYMIAQFDFDTHEMHTWSDVGSTVAVVRSVAKEKGVDVSTLDGKEIFDHYHDDPIYEKYVDKYYYVLANGIYNLQYAYDPQKIVIGGGISIREDLLDEVNQRLDVIFSRFTHAKIRPVVLTCQYHNDANLLGALYHFFTVNS